jgi:hypothetical protein
LHLPASAELAGASGYFKLTGATIGKPEYCFLVPNALDKLRNSPRRVVKASQTLTRAFVALLLLLVNTHF